jgi:hypothetical protein
LREYSPRRGGGGIFTKFEEALKTETFMTILSPINCIPQSNRRDYYSKGIAATTAQSIKPRTTGSADQERAEIPAEGKMLLGRTRCRLAGDIKMDLTQDGAVWIGLIWLRIGISGGFFCS